MSKHIRSTNLLNKHGYRFDESTYFDPVTGKSNDYIGTIHTHQNKSNSSAGPSLYHEKGDEYFATWITPLKPVMIMGYDLNLYGVIGNKFNGYVHIDNSILRHYNVNNIRDKSKNISLRSFLKTINLVTK
ncbi:MAG: hypothetical protein GX154_11540 [Clostridiales bacterium]|nr:hypothetical protein [Clostridiales bacterium]